MIHKVTLDFCTLSFYEHYVIAVINESTTIDFIKNNMITDVILEFYVSKKFIYITHRKYSYSVDPTTYTYTSSIQSLVAFVVVSHNMLAKSVTGIEKLFLKKPIKIFDNIDKACLWADDLMNENH